MDPEPPTPHDAMHTARRLTLLTLLTLTALAACGGDDAAPAPPPGGGANSSPANNSANNTTNNHQNNNNSPTNNSSANNSPANNSPANNTPIVGSCDPFNQDCPPEEQCTPIDGVPVCVPLNRFLYGDGELCQGGDCAPGLHCVDWGGEGGRRCAVMCDRSPDAACPEGQLCNAWIRDNPAIGLCQEAPPTCDIYAQDCPEIGQACTFGRDPATNDPIFVCAAAGEQRSGDPCSGDAGRCMAGLVCIRDTDDASSCHAVCQDDAGCPDGQTCSGASTTWGVTFCR